MVLLGVARMTFSPNSSVLGRVRAFDGVNCILEEYGAGGCRKDTALEFLGDFGFIVSRRGAEWSSSAVEIEMEL